MTEHYTRMELMICAAARCLEDGRTVAVGTGAPCAAAMLAQQTHATNLVIVFEAGGVAPMLPEMPISVGDSRTFFRAIMATGMADMMGTCSRGLVDYAFLGGAQIDRYGNLNSTVIGDYDQPRVRLPGSGGANDFASLCWHTIVLTLQRRERFVDRLDFLTTPGYLTGPGAREACGLPPGSGPLRIITDLAVLGFDPATKQMCVETVHPGITLEEVQQNTGFALLTSAAPPATPPPTVSELQILRERVDPQRYVIGRPSDAATPGAPPTVPAVTRDVETARQRGI